MNYATAMNSIDTAKALNFLEIEATPVVIPYLVRHFGTRPTTVEGGMVMSKEARDYWRFQRKLATIQHAKTWGNVSMACRTFGFSRAAYYRWMKIYNVEGEAGLRQRRPIAKNHPRRIPEESIDKVLELRTKYHLGPQRIVWYLERYHGITN